MGGAVRSVLTTLLELFGIALVVTGIAFIYWPAALIVGGVALVWVSREVTRS